MKLPITMLTASALLCCSLMVQAEEISEAELEQLRAELAEARVELAETARRVTEIQRKLIATQNELKDGGAIELLEHLDNTTFDFDAGSFVGKLGENDRNFTVRLNPLKSATPRLGVVLGGDQDRLEVVGLTPGGGAVSAGIERGDYLISVNGQVIDPGDSRSISEALTEVQIGDAIPVEIERDGERMSFDIVTSSAGFSNLNLVHTFRDATLEGNGNIFAREVEIRDLKDNPFKFEVLKDFEKDGISFFPGSGLGLGHNAELMNNHAGLQPYFGTDEGVIVLRIDEENSLNLKSGDVILSIDGQDVSRPLDLGPAIMERSKQGGEVLFEVMRNGVLTQIQGTAPDITPFGQSFRLRFEENADEERDFPQSPNREEGLHF